LGDFGANEILANKTRYYIYHRHYPERDEKSSIASGIKIGSQLYPFFMVISLINSKPF